MGELLSAVRDGREEKTRELLGSEHFYNLPSWNQGQGIVLLREALARGHCDIAKLLLSKGARVNNKFGHPINDPLHFAVCLPDNVDIVTLLINEGAKINSTNGDGCTPLHLAVLSNNEPATRLLLESQATPDAEDHNRCTPLHIAAKQGFPEMTALLLNYGAKPDTPSVNGFTPLHLACLHTKKDTASILLDHGADPNASSDEGTPLDLAFPDQDPVESLDCRLAIVEKLLKAGAKVNGFNNAGKPILHRAVEKNCPEIVAVTVGSSNVNAVCIDSSTKSVLSPIQIAAQRGLGEIAGMLISHGADINMPCNTTLGGNYTPLHLACCYGHIDIVKMLLAHGADTEAKSLEGRTPLLAAICHYNGNLEIIIQLVQLLVGSGANLMTTDHEKASILHAAAEKRCLPLARLILQRNLSVNLACLVNNPTITGLTPLHLAAANDSTELAEFLLDHGADINFVSKAPTSDGLSPLHVASKHAHANVIKLFLSRGADANLLSSQNQTPAHVLLSTRENFSHHNLQNATSALTILLENLADIDCTDKNGHSVLNLAVKLRCLTIVQTVLRYKPNPKTPVNCNSLRLAVISGTKFTDDVFSDFSLNLRIDAIKEVKDIIQTLMDYGVVFNYCDVKDSVVLHHAIRKGLSNAVRYLLKHGADFRATSDFGTPLHSAVRMLHMDIVKRLITMGAKVNAEDPAGKTPMAYINEKLSNINVSRDFGDSQICLEIARELLIGGADLSNDSRFLMIAIQKKNEGLVKLALERNADVREIESNGFTTLHMAVHVEDENLVKLLLEHGAKIDASDDILQTPLHMAVSSENEGIANILLDRGADIRIADCRGYTPLHHAACWGSVPIITRLLELGAETEIRNRKSLTPLLLAAEHGHGKAVVRLLQGGADPHARRPDGSTVLHLAAERTNKATVEAVLYYGGDVRARTSSGKTPLGSAMQACQPLIAEILLENDGYTSDMCCTMFHATRWFTRRRLEISADLEEVTHLHFLAIEALQQWPENTACYCRKLFMRDIADDFNADLKLLKSKTITKALTFFDILSKPKHQLVPLARNETVVRCLRKTDFIEEFPTLGQLLFIKWNAAVTREKLLSSGTASFNALITEAVANCVNLRQTSFLETLKRVGFDWVLRVLKFTQSSDVTVSNEEFVQYLLQIQFLLPAAVVENILHHLTNDELRKLAAAATLVTPTSPTSQLSGVRQLKTNNLRRNSR